MNTTNDLKLVSTDLWINPTATNQQITDSFATYTAAAFGYIYFDDGVSLDQLPSRFDLSLSLDDVTPGLATFTVS